MDRSLRPILALVPLLALASPGTAHAEESQPRPAPFVLPEELPPRLGDPGVLYLHVETTAPRLHLRVFDGIAPAYEPSRRRGGRVLSRFVCAAPCDEIIDAREGARYFFSGGAGSTSSDYFRLNERAGPVAVRVSLGNRRALNAGAIVTALGALLALSGGFFLGVGITGAQSDPSGSGPSRIAGASLLGAAAIAWVIGPVLVAHGVTSYRFSPAVPRSVIPAW